MNTKQDHAIAELQATLLIVAITISLAYLVYSQVRAPRVTGGLAFHNGLTLLGGSPPVVFLRVNTSISANLESMQLDNSSSTDGLFAFDGHRYSTTDKLCSPGVVTFFSVYSASPGTLQVSSDGKVWISGYWVDSVAVTPGWNEILVSNGSSCYLTLPDGAVVNSKGASISAIPLSTRSSTSFKFFIPTDGSSHLILLVFQGGFDRVEA